MRTFVFNNLATAMTHQLKKEGKFTYLDVGEGKPIVILHGLMGG